MSQQDTDFFKEVVESRRTHPEDEGRSSSGISDSDYSKGSASDGETSTAINKSSRRISQASVAPTIDMPISSLRSSLAFSSANTGPKGVLADAQSYEVARRRGNRLRKRQSQAYYAPPTFEEPKPSGKDEGMTEEQLMESWRRKRLEELKTGSVRQKRRSPSKRKYGIVQNVDAIGYLDAVEKVAADTVVVVLVYDPDSSESRFVEDCLTTLARRHVTVRFVKMQHTDAEMDAATMPAVLAYKSGELIANIMRIVDEIPTGRSLSPDSLEVVLKSENVLDRHDESE